MSHPLRDSTSHSLDVQARRWGRTTALLLIGVIFLLGVVTGVLGTHLYYAKRLQEPGDVADWIVDAGAERISKRLDLTHEQRRQLDRHLDKTRLDVRSLRQEIIERIEIIRTDAIEGLWPILDESQRQELRRIHEEEGKYLDSYLQTNDPDRKR